MVPMLTSLYNFSSSTFVLIRHLLSFSTSPKMFLNIFLLKIISVFFSADLLITHVSAPYVTTESVTVLYG